MIVILLRLVFGLMVRVNWTWTTSVSFADAILKVDDRNVFEFDNTYLDSTDILPAEKDMKTRGRGSDKFKTRGADRYSMLDAKRETFVDDHGICDCDRT